MRHVEALVVLATLFFGQLVDVIRQLLEVLLLLGQLLLQLEQLLLLSLADGPILVGLFALLERIPSAARRARCSSVSLGHGTEGGAKGSAAGGSSHAAVGRLDHGLAEHGCGSDGSVLVLLFGLELW
jgi:hypothetical protein